MLSRDVTAWSFTGNGETSGVELFVRATSIGVKRAGPGPWTEQRRLRNMADSEREKVFGSLTRGYLENCVERRKDPPIG
jgi:hypothetical protein